MKQIAFLLFLILTNTTISFSQCNILNTYSLNTVLPDLWGQSFTANCSGYLDYVHFIPASSGVASTDTLKIYSGNNTTSLIYSQHFNNINIQGLGDSLLIYITGLVPIFNGSQYTFEFHTGNISLDASGDVYPGGEGILNGSNIVGLDLNFGVGIQSTVSINESILNSVNIYPNPCNGIFTVFLDETRNYHLTVSNSLGQKILNKNITNSSEQFISMDVSPGIYYLILEMEENTFSNKLVIY